MTQEYLTDGEIDHYIQRILGQCANLNYDISPWLMRQLAQGLVVVKVDSRRGAASSCMEIGIAESLTRGCCSMTAPQSLSGCREIV